MNLAIENNKLSYIRKHLSDASLADLKYSAKIGNFQAMWLLFQNKKIRQEIYENCDVGREKRLALDPQYDPMDVVKVIDDLIY